MTLTDMSTTPPIRNPRRMPFFTQALTRQPVGEDESGSAARILPSLSAILNWPKTSKCCFVYCSGLLSKRSSILACNSGAPDRLQQSRGLQNFLDALQALRFGRAHGQAKD